MPRTRNSPLPRADSSIDRVMERQQFSNEKSLQVSNAAIEQGNNFSSQQYSKEASKEGSTARTYTLPFETVDHIEDMVRALRRQYPNHFVTREAVVQKAIAVFFTMWQQDKETFFLASDFVAKKEKPQPQPELRDDFE